MSDINKYLPKVLQPILEFQVINASLDVELTTIDDNIVDMEKEVIVATASEYGISRWENTLGITPSATDTLEIRRFRITTLLANKPPYTYRWLKNKLTLIVGNSTGWTLDVNYGLYKVTIVLSGLDTTLMGEVQRQLRNIIPANMILEIGGSPLNTEDIIYGIALHKAIYYNFES